MIGNNCARGFAWRGQAAPDSPLTSTGLTARQQAAAKSKAIGAISTGGAAPEPQVTLDKSARKGRGGSAALDQVAQSQASSLRRTQTARLRLAQSEAAVEDKESIAQQYRDEMSDAKSEADQQLGAAQDILSNLEAEERQRLAALAEEERRQSQAAASAAVAALNQSSSANCSAGSPKLLALTPSRRTPGDGPTACSSACMPCSIAMGWTTAWTGW